MASKKSRAMRRLHRRRRRSTSIISLRSGTSVKGNTIKRTNHRIKKAGKQSLTIRDVPNTNNEPYEYVVYLFTKTRDDRNIKSTHDTIVEFVKSCLNDFKIVKHKLETYPETVGVSCIKLATESDLMMFMLCYREHVRKIFRLVNEA